MARTRLLVDIEGNSAKLVSELEKSRKSIQGLANDVKFVKWDSIVTLGEKTYQMGRQIYDAARNIADMANEIDRNSRTLNMSTDAYQKWVYAAKMADVNQEDLMNGFKFMTRSISEASQGAGDAAKAFEVLGIRIKDSSGKTKDQQVVMLETIDALNKYADGANRDALMLAIFGRSWMTLKPLINEGTEAIAESGRELVKMGGVLGDVVLNKGSQAEAQFKKLETNINAFKISLAPAALEVAKFFQTIMDEAKKAYRALEPIRKWGKEKPYGYLGDLLGLNPKAEQGEELPGLAVSHGAGYISAYGKKQAPGLPGKEVDALEKELANYAKAWGDYADQEITTLEKLNQVYIDQREDRIRIEEYAREKILEGEAVFNQEYIEAWDATNQMYVDISRRRSEGVGNIINSLSQNIADVWATNMNKMITDSENWRDALSNIFKGMGDAFVSAVMRMITQWIIFGNVQGMTGTGWGTSGQTGYGGIIGGIGSIISLLEKGGITSPMLAHYPIHSYAEGGIARTPQLGIFGEGGGEGEAFVPLQGGKIPVKMDKDKGDESGIQNANVFQIFAMDPISWRDFVRRNPEAIIEAISRNTRGAGSMRGTIKGVG